MEQLLSPEDIRQLSKGYPEASPVSTALISLALRRARAICGETQGEDWENKPNSDVRVPTLDPNTECPIEQIALRIGEEYAETRVFDVIPIMEEWITEFKMWVDQQYLALPDDLTIEFVDFDPYDSVEELIADVNDNRVLQVVNLYSSDNPLDSDYVLHGHETNLRFRAWHDYVHHYGLKLGFDAEGESAAAAHAWNVVPPNIRNYVASDLLGQASSAMTYGYFSRRRFVWIDDKTMSRLYDLAVERGNLLERSDV